MKPENKNELTSGDEKPHIIRALIISSILRCFLRYVSTASRASLLSSCCLVAGSDGILQSSISNYVMTDLLGLPLFLDLLLRRLESALASGLKEIAIQHPRSFSPLAFSPLFLSKQAHCGAEDGCVDPPLRFRFLISWLERSRQPECSRFKQFAELFWSWRSNTGPWSGERAESFRCRDFATTGADW